MERSLLSHVFATPLTKSAWLQIVYFARLNSKQPIWMKSTRNILEQQPYGISWKKLRTVGQREAKRRVPLKICCQLFKICSQSFCCITLLTSCKRKHIMHANWSQQQQIPTQRWCKWASLKTSAVFIRMKFPLPIGKQTVSHCTLFWSGSGTKVYQWSFCQITMIMTRQWCYLHCVCSQLHQRTLWRQYSWYWDLDWWTFQSV